MSKVKYKYNPHTLNYEKVETSWKDRIKSALPWFAGGIVFATIVVIFAFSFIKSPKERAQRREIEQWKYQYQLINDRLQEIELVLNDVQKRDDNLYRVILEASPYSKQKREMGTGGSNRYKDLDGFENSELIISTKKKLDKVSKKLFAQTKSFDEVKKLAKKKEEMLRCIPAIMPVANKDLTAGVGGYGWRIDPIYRTRAMHTGMDFPSKTGRPVYATGDGVVENVESNFWGYGNIVLVNHGFGYQTMYAHLSEFKSKIGQKVKRGEVVGLIGSTGKSTAPHLHYEVIKNGEKVNPVNYYFNDLDPAAYEEMLKASSDGSASFD
jgi:murein DD-endopeptidase MepM/ murein hydrolase activator NlpD